MADSLKFGPEWLRTLNQSLAASVAASTACTPPSSEGGGHGSGTVPGTTVPRPALTLARHRYGREEMLALFDPGLPPPPVPPAALAVLFTDRAQAPLALVQTSDEETRVWNRGVNSDSVLRLSKSTGGGGPPGAPLSGPGGTSGRGGGAPSGGPGGLRGQSRSLGIPGRGAGPGIMSGSAPFYRYDDSGATGGDSSGEGIRGGGIGSLRPGRPFIRMQSSERSWSDRNGADHEWGGGSGPGNSALGTSPRKDFARGFDSWRRQGRNAINSEQDDDPPATGGWRSSTTKWTNRTGGSSWRSDSDPIKDTGGWTVARSNSNSWGEDHAPPRGSHPHVHRPWDPAPHTHGHPASHGSDNDTVSGPLPEWATEATSESRGSFDSSGAFHGGTPLSDDEDGSGNSSVTRGHRHSALTREPNKRVTPPLRPHDSMPPAVAGPGLQNSVGDVAERLRRQPPDVSKSTPGDCDPPRSVTSRSTDQPGGAKDVEQRRTTTEKLSPPLVTTVATLDRDKENSVARPDEEMDRMREVADDLVAKLMEDEDHRTGAPTPSSVTSSSDKWYYRDPQGDVQGPFSSSEMLDWFRSGYFNVTLLVRRACDERYSSLGDMMKQWGRLPFMPGGPPVPPIKADALPPVNSVSVPPMVAGPQPPPASDILSDTHGHSLLLQQYQYQCTMLQRQLILGQQAAAVHAAAQAAIGELSQSDRWATLSPIEQQRLVTERLTLHQMLGVPPLVPPVSVPPPSIVDLFSVAAAQQQPGQQVPQPPGQPPHSQQAAPAPNPVAQLISQMQLSSRYSQGAVPATVLAKEHQPSPQQLVDPLQQLIQQMGGGLPTVSSAPSGPPTSSQPLVGVGLDSDGPGRTLLQTLNAGKQPVMAPPRLPPVQVDSVWGGSIPAGYSLGVGAAAPWVNASVAGPVPAVSSAPPVPPGQLPTLPLSLWDLAQQQGKDVKTEHQVLEQQLRAEEERRTEEHRKREETEVAIRKQKEHREKEEEKRQQTEIEEEAEKKKLHEEEEERRKKKLQEDEERKKKKQLEEEERKRKKQQEEEDKKRKKQQEEEEKRKKKEEERRQREQEEEEQQRKKEQEESERQLREEEERERKKKQQEAKKIEEAMKKEKEKAAQKREEEKKRKEAEKEKKKKAEEARKKEEEEKKKQEEEERARLRRQEQQREALRRLQEQQEKARQAAALRPAPWTAAPAAPAANATQQPLAEIQRQERERERQLQQQQIQQQQQQLLLQQQQQNANAAAQNSVVAAQAGNIGIGGLQLRWAEVKPQVPAPKSLTEIQQEEQENLAKQQMERDRLQQQQQQQQQATVAPTVATASIWGSAPQSLSWASSVSASVPASPWGSAAVNANSTNSGFWEDAAKAPVVVSISKNRNATNHNNNIINNSSGTSGNNKNSSNGMNSTQPWKALQPNTKTRSKKEEAVVMKLFEPRPDEFTQWCTDALGSLKHSIDVPTFVGFLRDIESAYEVKDYVRVYLGEGRDAQEFSRQFLERRSRLQQQKVARDRTPEDDLSTPALAITPSQDFQEVKGKGKKMKKNRMYKVDSRILGFSVTAAQDRLNVGERDFGEGM